MNEQDTESRGTAMFMDQHLDNMINSSQPETLKQHAGSRVSNRSPCFHRFPPNARLTSMASRVLTQAGLNKGRVGENQLHIIPEVCELFSCTFY